jgi:uncharacterized NAD(P)/FAD-binding protein YdhS
MTSLDQNFAGPLDVAIIGGGFAGAAAALHLLDRLGPTISIGIFETRHEPGRGVAYSTRHASHLLNIPAGRMSFFSTKPDHFVEWAIRACNRPVDGNEYLPRRLYGDYIEALLNAAIGKREVQWLPEEVVSLRETGAGLELISDRGRRIGAQVALLALGGNPSRGPIVFAQASPHFYVPDPWRAEAISAPPANQSVLIVGSGLTAIDQILALREAGHRGRIHVVSRHGLTPRHSEQCLDRKATWSRMQSHRVSAILRRLRQEIDEAQLEGVRWQALFDSARGDLQSLWQSLDLQERRRFLRHLRSHWDVHKHRIPAKTAAIIDDEQKQGSLIFHAGRILDYREHDDAVEILYRPRSEEQVAALTVSRIYNCSGALGAYKGAEQPLVASLLESGSATLDACELGLDTSLDGALIRADGSVSERVYAIGSVRRGTDLEATAVPDIRVQAETFSELLAQQTQRAIVSH